MAKVQITRDLDSYREMHSDLDYYRDTCHRLMKEKTELELINKKMCEFIKDELFDSMYQDMPDELHYLLIKHKEMRQKSALDNDPTTHAILNQFRAVLSEDDLDKALEEVFKDYKRYDEE